MYLLDTNVVSELRKARTKTVAPSVVAWAEGVVGHELFISVITLFELEMGALQVERRDPAQGRILRSWIDGQVKEAFRDRIMPIDAAVALRCAGLHIPDPRSYRDAFIGATAKEHGLLLVTRNVRDFERMGLELLNPWMPR